MEHVTGAHEHSNALTGILEGLLEKMGMSHRFTEFMIEMISDTVLIFLLLFFIMFAISYLETYVDFEKLKSKLVKLDNIGGYILATFMGMISPFCSCTIIPVLIGMVNVGVPMGINICFLTSASLLNIAALITLSSTAGPQFTSLYIVISLMLVYITSYIMTKVKVGEIAVYYDIKDECCEHSHETVGQRHRLHVAYHNTRHVFKGAWLFIIIGVAISSATLVYLPFDKISDIINGSSLSVLAGAVVGLPIHSDVFTILPILLLLLKISPGVAMTFALATMSISLPEFILLTRVFKNKFIWVYTLVLFILSTLIGYILILF